MERRGHTIDRCRGDIDPAYAAGGVSDMYHPPLFGARGGNQTTALPRRFRFPRMSMGQCMLGSSVASKPSAPRKEETLVWDSRFTEVLHSLRALPSCRALVLVPQDPLTLQLLSTTAHLECSERPTWRALGASDSRVSRPCTVVGDGLEVSHRLCEPISGGYTLCASCMV